MKLVRSDSPEVVNSIASTRALACWGSSVLILICIASAPGLLVFLIVSMIASLRAATWLGVPVILASNGYGFWCRSPRRSWIIAENADRVFFRLFVQRGNGRTDTQEPDTVMFEASEIVSMRPRVVDVFLYGSKPKSLEWLVIEPVQAIAQGSSYHIGLLLNRGVSDRQIYVSIEGGCLAISWRWCRPDLQEFLKQTARESPSIAVDVEERSELDLNGIWNGLREKPDAKQRQMLVQAKRLGLGCKCATLLARYRAMSFREASEYLTEIEQQEAGGDQPIGCSTCRF